MREELEKIKLEAAVAFNNAADAAALEQASIKYLSRKGLVAGLFKLLGQASAEDRPAFGQALNDLKAELEAIKAMLKK